MKYIWPVLLALSVVAQQAVPQPAPQSFRISGAVVNGVSGDPVSRAEVQIGHSQSQGQLQSIVTGRDGRFAFEGLSRGKYWLSAKRRGFPRQSFEQHGNFFTAIAVGPNLDSENLVFRLRPHASISGTVLDEGGDPVRNAVVMLFRSGVESGRRGVVMRDQSQTDDRGVYHFGNLNPGTFYVAVSATPWYAQYGRNQGIQYMRVEGNTFMFRQQKGNAAPAPPPNPTLDVAYPITYYSGATDSNEATPITLKMGERATADLTLMPVPAVHLRVSLPGSGGETNKAVNHGPRNIMMSQEVFGTYQAMVFAQQAEVAPGQVELTGIPPGRFDMKIQTFGKTPVTREEQVDVTGDAAINAPATASQPLTVVGTVTMDGRALPRPAFIRLWRRGSGDPLSGQVSAKGDFEIHQDHVVPGKYEVAVFGIPGAAVRTIRATGVQIVGQSVAIQNGGTVRLNVDLAQGLGEISGTATRDGKPVSGAMIVLVPQDYENNGTLIRRDQSDSDGTFTLRAVVPGKYTVLALENAWDLEWLSPSVLTPYMAGGTPVDVAAHQKYDIKLNAQ